MIQPDSGIYRLEQSWQLIQDLTTIRRERRRRGRRAAFTYQNVVSQCEEKDHYTVVYIPAPKHYIYVNPTSYS
jgi:hypothetical protein